MLILILILPYLWNRICAKYFSGLHMVYCQIKWALCTFHALKSENSFYSFNWVFLTTVCGNQFRCRRPYMGYISASLCFRVPFLVLYKLYIISCLIRVTSPQHRLWSSWIKDRNGGYCLARELRSASGHDFSRRSLLYSALICFSFKDLDPFCLLLLLCFWAFLAWTAGSCDFSQMLKLLMVLAWYFFPLRHRSKLAIIPCSDVASKSSWTTSFSNSLS